jgi:hypothetical protein
MEQGRLAVSVLSAELVDDTRSLGSADRLEQPGQGGCKPLNGLVSDGGYHPGLPGRMDSEKVVVGQQLKPLMRPNEKALSSKRTMPRIAPH